MPRIRRAISCPQAGTLTRLRFPAGGAALARRDRGARGRRRRRPLRCAAGKARRLGRGPGGGDPAPAAALAETRVAGIVTNRDFLVRVLAPSGDFAAGEVDTGFIARHRAALLPLPHALVRGARGGEPCGARGPGHRAAQAAWRGCDPHSPWRRCDGWRIAGTAPQSLRFHDGGDERSVVRVASARRTSHYDR